MNIFNLLWAWFRRMGESPESTSEIISARVGTTEEQMAALIINCPLFTNVIKRDVMKALCISPNEIVDVLLSRDTTHMRLLNAIESNRDWNWCTTNSEDPLQDFRDRKRRNFSAREKLFSYLHAERGFNRRRQKLDLELRPRILRSES